MEPVKESLDAPHGDSVPVEMADYQEDFSAQEFKAYCKRRVDLFLKYKQRQDEKVFHLVACHHSIKLVPNVWHDLVY